MFDSPSVDWHWRVYRACSMRWSGTWSWWMRRPGGSRRHRGGWEQYIPRGWRRGRGARERLIVFVHDVDRVVEDKFSKTFLCEGYLKEEEGRLRHFIIPSHRTSLGMPFCPWWMKEKSLACRKEIFLLPFFLGLFSIVVEGHGAIWILIERLLLLLLWILSWLTRWDWCMLEANSTYCLLPFYPFFLEIKCGFQSFS